ncbi:Uncharacterized protein Fot_42060 [Forsythia ovata]|uniref:Uncharacterized protein n=1 Tax=Forsythia ovata TaxID=205694 RepID=A0ABD1RLV7_9LAMI
MEGMVEMSLHISMQIGYKRTARPEFFDVNPRRYSKADYKLVVDGIENIAARRFRQYKANKKMVEEREEQTQQASSSGMAVNEHDVVLKVLGERKGHRRAVGRVLRGTSRSHSSTTTLRNQHSISESTQAINALKPRVVEQGIPYCPIRRLVLLV